MATSPRPLESRFSPVSQIVRRRLLPIPGNVMVRVGDRVQPNDIVAEASIKGQLHPIDLARALKVSARSVPRRLEVAEGQSVPEGGTLASVRRLWIGVRQVRAPFGGTVQGISEGIVFFRKEPQVFRLRAYLPGEVCEQFPGRGVAVRTIGCLIRGVWGSGDEGSGPLMTVVTSPGETLTWQKVLLSHRATILIGGILEDPRVLFRAKRFRVSGLVAGSMLPRLQAVCEGLGLPVVISEGMGRIPMAEPIFEALRSCDGFPAVISGTDRDGRSGPELIVPLPANTKAPSQAVVRPLGVGASVRLTRPPYLGAVGTVVSLAATPQETAIGTRSDGAVVGLPDGRRVFVPYSNLELLE